jgi:hypothetical protein
VFRNKPDLELTCTLQGVNSLAFDVTNYEIPAAASTQVIKIRVAGVGLTDACIWHVLIEDEMLAGSAVEKVTPATPGETNYGCNITIPAAPLAGIYNVTVILEVSTAPLPPLSYSGSFTLTRTL